MGLYKDRLIFDAADLTESDNIGAHLRAGSDGDLLTSTLIGAKEALDVNVVGGEDSGIFEEDSVHVSGNNGQFILAVRQDADVSMVDTDGDYAPLQVDENGRLKVVADLEVTNSFEKVEDSAHSSGDVGAFTLAVRQDTLVSSVDTDGDYAAFKLNSRGGLWTVPVGTVADDQPDSENPVKMGQRAVSGALAAVSATNDRADLISDLYRRTWVNSGPNIALATGNVTVGALEVALPAVALAGRRRIIVQNTSNNDIFVGNTGLSTSTGIRVGKGATLELEAGPNLALFAIATGAGNDVRVLEMA